jgi:glycerol uptake facilitator-like aquaporin
VQYKTKKQVAVPAETERYWSKLLGCYELKTRLVFKAMFIEFVGTALQTFVVCATVVAVIVDDFSFTPALLIAVAQFIIVAFFILATAKATGGHLNPMISAATMVAGLTSPVRALLYVCAQVVGAIVGAGLLKVILDDATFDLSLCTLGSVSAGRAFLAESVGACVLLFIAFGTALDVGQREVFGPVLGPFFVSFTVGLIIFFGSGLGKGFIGPVANPGRCTGPAVVADYYHGLWIYWLGSMTGAVLMGLLYRFLPPGFHDTEKKAEKVSGRRLDDLTSG